jgi:Zn-dependent peptidase ImmA (M78 family)
MSKAEAAADRIREKHAPGDNLPVPVEAIATKLGAAVIYERLGADVSGLLVREEARVIIGVNEKHSLARQRFTIAHELGHLVLHGGRPLVVDAARINLRDTRSSLATDWEEIEANGFAAELIMPKPVVLRAVRQAANQGKVDFRRLRTDMAALFGVSAQAMEFRLSNLGLLQPE